MNNKQPSVYIVLLNYNTYKDTIECIKSLKNIEYENYHIVIVDNNSINNSEEYITEYIKDINNTHFIKSVKNLGFSGGNNLGIKWSLEQSADYICLLNNDTIVEPTFLKYLVTEMESDKNIGISSGKIMYYSEPEVIWAAGGKVDELKCIGHNGRINLKDDIKFNSKEEVSFLTGCLQLISREVFENIGLYEDEYFLYMEDVDFCLRASRAGYKLLYVPQSKIYHKVSVSTGGQSSPLVTYYMNRNRLLFNKKHQNNKIKSLIFIVFYLTKLSVDLFRKSRTYKYLLLATKDHIKGKYGERKFN